MHETRDEFVHIDDAGRWGVQRKRATKLRLLLRRFAPGHEPKLSSTNFFGVEGDRAKALFVLGARGHDQLARVLVRDLVGFTPFVKTPVPLDAQLRLEGIARVVDPRVNHAAVPARDLAPRSDLSLDDHDRVEPLGELVRAGEAHHASADHDRIDCFRHRHSP